MRGLLAVLLVVFGVSGQGSGAVSFIAVLAAVVLMATALTRECPVYRVLRTGTAPRSAEAPPVPRG